MDGLADRGTQAAGSGCPAEADRLRSRIGELAEDLAGDSARAAEEITAGADAAGLAGSQRTGADTCARYLNGRHEYLHYDQALGAGWPIATGVIEGACRHLIADRRPVHTRRLTCPCNQHCRRR